MVSLIQRCVLCFGVSSSRCFSSPAMLVLGAAALAVAGCDLYGVDAASPGQRPGSGPGAAAADLQTGQAMLQVAAIPADVECVRVTVAGTSRSEEREIDAVAGAMLSETLLGLPLGSVTFTGEAFAAACSAVSKTTIAAWASEPVTASIVLGRLSTVTLEMARNGRAKVEVSFDDEAACTPLGMTCRLASECCSKRCTGKICASAADAGTAE